MRGIKFMRFKVELNQKKTVLYKSRLIIKNTWSYKDPRKKVFFYWNFLNRRKSKLWGYISNLVRVPESVNPKLLQ